MRTKPALALSVAVSAFLFITALASLVIQPDLSMIAPAWGAALAISIILIAMNLITGAGEIPAVGKRPAILLDILFSAAVLVAAFSGYIHPGYSIKPPGLGAAFGYGLILPTLVLVSSVLGIKDSIDMIYGFNQKGREVLIFTAIRLSAVVAVLILGGILLTIIYRGAGALSWEFLTTPHRSLGQEGGISTAIEGSMWMILGAMLVSAPIGIGAAIYLNEYSKNMGLKRLITIAVSVLNGVPSVVFGLFALAFLVTIFGISLLTGSVILGLINLPTIILTSQEALKSVPNSLREGSMALGATRWQTIKKVVLPSSMPGILTGLIISVSKAAGETAPIMWTAVTFTATPVNKIFGIFPDPFQPVNNLDYHLLNLIYFLGAWDVESKAWGTALVLLILVLSTNMLAIVVRNYYRKKITW
ncbi:MAG TPA: phosphate ABC transporter permease PstA [Methanotrichaceae archaeon]|nr:phosphate ABC transporter permease PstA [Methanotrichaceae archaeon]